MKYIEVKPCPAGVTVDNMYERDSYPKGFAVYELPDNYNLPDNYESGVLFVEKDFTTITLVNRGVIKDDSVEGAYNINDTVFGDNPVAVEDYKGAPTLETVLPEASFTVQDFLKAMAVMQDPKLAFKE